MTSFGELFEQAEQEDAYHVAGAILDFTEEISSLMDRHRVSRAELARRLDSSPSYVTKILRGNANFTLASMVKLARALGAELTVGLMPAESRNRDRVERNLGAELAIVRTFTGSGPVDVQYEGSSEDAGDEQTALAA